MSDERRDPPVWAELAILAVIVAIFLAFMGLGLWWGSFPQ